LITRKRSDQAYYIIANSDDWRWYSTQVPEKLKELYETGHQLVIFSNQSSIKGAMLGASSEKIRTMVNKILADLNAKAGQTIPVQVLFATASDGEYRKPNTGMWRHFVEHMNAGVQPNLEESFFVGDAAGRDGDINNGADSDKQFAENIGLRFVLPEDMFGCAIHCHDDVDAVDDDVRSENDLDLGVCDGIPGDVANNPARRGTIRPATAHAFAGKLCSMTCSNNCVFFFPGILSCGIMFLAFIDS
jgi:DNA 3'-phosphatase